MAENSTAAHGRGSVRLRLVGDDSRGATVHQVRATSHADRMAARELQRARALDDVKRTVAQRPSFDRAIEDAKRRAYLIEKLADSVRQARGVLGSAWLVGALGVALDEEITRLGRDGAA